MQNHATKKFIRSTFNILRKAMKNYKKDDPIRLAGTTAYFAIFAMAPIVIIIISLLGMVLNQEQVSSKIYEEINGLLGEKGTEYIRSVVDNYTSAEKGIAGTIIGIVIFIITSTTFFTVLQNSINYIWKIKAKPKRGFFKALKDRALSFGLILSLGFIMLVSLLIEASLTILKDYLNALVPEIDVVFIRVANIILSLGILTLIFALIYRFLPDAIVKWKVTWIGAFITALLFEGGKTLIGALLGNTNVGFMYGAAGSLIIILLWVFYTSIIFFYGAEITQQYALMIDRTIVPKSHAVKIRITEVED